MKFFILISLITNYLIANEFNNFSSNIIESNIIFIILSIIIVAGIMSSLMTARIFPLVVSFVSCLVFSSLAEVIK
jgi:hypothetical protein